jgi:hypothetical protein
MPENAEFFRKMQPAFWEYAAVLTIILQQNID